jgi:hypothetical protein
MKRAFLPTALLALLIVQGCRESSDSATGLRESTVTEIRLTEKTMDGNEAEASNGLMTLRVRGLYQQLFSGGWYMGIKVTPLRDLTISKVTCYSFTGKNTRLRDYEINFYPPAGQFLRLVERGVDVPFTDSASSMLVTFYDQRGDVLSRFEITHIVDHLIGVGILPAASREMYLNPQQ